MDTHAAEWGSLGPWQQRVQGLVSCDVSWAVPDEWLQTLVKLATEEQDLCICDPGRLLTQMSCNSLLQKSCIPCRSIKQDS